MTRWLALAVLLTASAASADEVKRAGFTVPLPPGFVVAPDSPINLDAEHTGLALAERAPPTLPGGVPANLVALPIPLADFTDVKLCEAAAKKLAAGAHLAMQPAKLVDLPVGKSCQFGGLSRIDPHHFARFTIVESPRSAWLLTCNYDERDPVGAAGCDAVLSGWSFDAPPATARGADFTVPLPAGFEVQAPKPASAGGLDLVATAPAPVARAFRASIIIGPLPAAALAADFTDPTLCAAVAAQLGTQQKMTMSPAVVVELPLGKSCQLAGVSQDNANQALRATVVRSSKSLWTVTCNYDVRDQPARAACDEVLRGWKFDR